MRYATTQCACLPRVEPAWTVVATRLHMNNAQQLVFGYMQRGILLGIGCKRVYAAQSSLKGRRWCHRRDLLYNFATVSWTGWRCSSSQATVACLCGLDVHWTSCSLLCPWRAWETPAAASLCITARDACNCGTTLTSHAYIRASSLRWASFCHWSCVWTLGGACLPLGEQLLLLLPCESVLYSS